MDRRMKPRHVTGELYICAIFSIDPCINLILMYIVQVDPVDVTPSSECCDINSFLDVPMAPTSESLADLISPSITKVGVIHKLA